MERFERLRETALKQGGTITAAQARALGCSRASLAGWAARGRLERVAHGVYLLPEGMEDELFVLSLRSRRLVFSHETALFLNGLSERTPARHAATFPRSAVPREGVRDALRCHYVARELLDLGRSVRRTSFGNEVPCYDAERTICDLVRSRNKMDEETFLAGLRLYAARPDKDLGRLDAYARRFRVSRAVARCLEVLL